MQMETLNQSLELKKKNNNDETTTKTMNKTKELTNIL